MEQRHDARITRVAAARRMGGHVRLPPLSTSVKFLRCGTLAAGPGAAARIDAVTAPARQARDYVMLRGKGRC